MSDEELRMDAYYYGFGETFQIEIDRILSAVACAGKAFHHTEDWNCEATPRSEHEGATPIDWIQNRANEAADAMARLRAENEKLRAALKPFAATAEWDVSGTEHDDDLFRPIPPPYNRAPVLRVIHLRAAKAALGESDE